MFTAIRSLRDPRWFQIAMLAGLLVYGALALDFELRAPIVFATAATALCVQVMLSIGSGRAAPVPIEIKSALISTLSLCLLLRTSSVEVAIIAAAAAIGSKFALRIRGKHVFNPTAFGLAVVLIGSGEAWISAGQWGAAPLAALWIAGLGSLVIRRARRSDITWAFLASYLAMLLARAGWLGDPISIPIHHLSSGAFLIFAFFMISDPKTTPDARLGRIAFAAAVAATALVLRFGFYQTNALVWALVGCAPLVPILDRFLPAERYDWSSHGDPRRKSRNPGESRDEEKKNLADVLAGLGAAT